ncbi:hypothetical protein SUGI_0831810 [Cryptomeria japonica]|nr:hypothetical protein SUGI_0831810 [Cryptomeria japonica]
MSSGQRDSGLPAREEGKSQVWATGIACENVCYILRIQDPGYIYIAYLAPKVRFPMFVFTLKLLETDGTIRQLNATKQTEPTRGLAKALAVVVVEL